MSRFGRSWDGAGLASRVSCIEGGGETEKVGEGGGRPENEGELCTEPGPGTSRFRGNVGVAATTPICGMVATVKAAGSVALELAASFKETALVLVVGAPSLEGSFPVDPGTRLGPEGLSV